MSLYLNELKWRNDRILCIYKATPLNYTLARNTLFAHYDTGVVSFARTVYTNLLALVTVPFSSHIRFNIWYCDTPRFSMKTRPLCVMTTAVLSV